MTQLFTRSPLSRQALLTSGEVDRFDILFRDAAVQNAAGRLKAARTRLREKTEHRSAISEAFTISDSDVGNISSIGDAVASIVAALNRLSEQVEQEFKAATVDHEMHDKRHSARMRRLAPLRLAVSAQVTELTHERNHLSQKIDSIKRATTMRGGAGSAKFANLLAAGLTREQIANLGPDHDDPEVQIQSARDRMNAIVSTLLPPLEQFLADPLFDTACIVGLGFDDLIKIRSEAEKVPA